MGGEVLRAMTSILTTATTSAVEFQLNFANGDLQALPSDAVNEALMASVPETDLFLLSHVVRESQACKHEVLPSLLLRSKPGAVFIFLDMHWGDLEHVAAVVSRI